MGRATNRRSQGLYPIIVLNGLAWDKHECPVSRAAFRILSGPDPQTVAVKGVVKEIMRTSYGTA